MSSLVSSSLAIFTFLLGVSKSSSSSESSLIGTACLVLPLLARFTDALDGVSFLAFDNVVEVAAAPLPKSSLSRVLTLEYFWLSRVSKEEAMHRFRNDLPCSTGREILAETFGDASPVKLGRIGVGEDAQKQVLFVCVVPNDAFAGRLTLRHG